MLMVQRDKPLRDYNSTDFVKYFAKKFVETHQKEYPVVFQRDCAIMLKVMRKFHEADVAFRDIFPFIDKMFKEYPRRRRFKPIDMNWIFSMTEIYLNVGDKLNGGAQNKAKAPAMELDDEMKEWLRKEKAKWMK